MSHLRSILLATDFRKASDEAATVVVRLAQTLGSRVTALHVREEFLTWPVTPFENQDRLTERLRGEKVDLAEFQVHTGPVADVVTRKAQEVGADLLVIGTGEKIRQHQLSVGPIAESILSHADSPVLAVNPYGPPVEFKTILCPVDHSRLSRLALEDGIRMARAFGGRVIVLSVVPDVSWLTAAIETGQLAEAQLEHTARWVAEFDEFLSTVSFDGVEWKREVRHGSAPEQIVACAGEEKADLLVMGATGRTGLVRVLLGSVTRRVLRQLPCSLLLVKEQSVFEEECLHDLETIDRLAAEGRKLLLDGSPAEAAGRFRQALALEPYNPTLLEGLIEACDQLGQEASAQRYRNRMERIRLRAANQGA